MQFGETETDTDVAKISKCRAIAQEIIKFGVTQTELLLVIQYLSFELEDHEHMVDLVAMTKEFLKPEGILFADKVG